MDLQDFFPSITGARIQTIFRMLGYPESVADLLGGICTNAVPRRVWNGIAIPGRAHPAYPPALAARRAHITRAGQYLRLSVDCRLTGLARSAGAEYTRYADDLAFSGGEEFERGVERFSTPRRGRSDGRRLQVNHRKTRIMRQGVRQRLAGLVANERMNVPASRL